METELFFWLTSSSDTPTWIQSVEPSSVVWPHVQHSCKTESLLLKLYETSDSYKNTCYYYNVNKDPEETHDQVLGRFTGALFEETIQKTSRSLRSCFPAHQLGSVCEFLVRNKLMHPKCRWPPICAQVLDLPLKTHWVLAALLFRVNAGSELQDAIRLRPVKKDNQYDVHARWALLERFLDAHTSLVKFVDVCGEAEKTEANGEERIQELDKMFENVQLDEGQEPECERGMYEQISQSIATMDLKDCRERLVKNCAQRNVQVWEEKYADCDSAWEECETRMDLVVLHDACFSEDVSRLWRGVEYVYAPSDDLFLGGEAHQREGEIEVVERLHSRLRKEFGRAHPDVFVEFRETRGIVERNPEKYAKLDEERAQRNSHSDYRNIQPHRNVVTRVHKESWRPGRGGKVNRDVVVERLINVDVFPVEEYAIYHATLHRVNVAVDLQKVMKGWVGDKQNAETLWLLQRFIGNHLELLLYMVESANVSDEGLESLILTEKNNTRVNVTELAPFCRFYPTEDRAIHCGSLPDLTNYLDRILPKRRSTGGNPPVLHILSKCLPYCCQIRDLISTCQKECARNLSIGGLLRGMILCSLQGMYRNVGYRPSVYQMMRNLKFMDFHPEANFTTVFMDESKQSFIGMNYKILYYSIREYLNYLLTFVPCIKEQTDMNPVDWEQNFSSTRAVMDVVRVWSDENPTLENVFKSIGSTENSIKRSRRVGTNRFQKLTLMCTLLKLLRDSMDETVQNMFEKRWEIEHIPAVLRMLKTQAAEGRTSRLDECVSEEMRIMNAALDESMEGENVVERTYNYLSVVLEASTLSYTKVRELWNPVGDEVKNAITKYAMAVHPNEEARFEVLLLPQFGAVDICTVEALNNTARLYKRVESDSVMLCAIHHLSMKDFFTALHFIKSVVTSRSMRLIPINETQKRKIDSAMFQVRHSFLGSDRIADDAYKIFYTPCCDRITNLCGRNYYGNQSVTCNVFTGELECATKRTSDKASNVRSAILKDRDDQYAEFTAEGLEEVERDQTEHWLDSGDIYESYRPCMYKNESRKLARKLRKLIEHVECKGTRVMEINIRGFMLEKYSVEKNNNTPVVYLHCPSCASLDVYDSRRWYGTEYKCRACWACDPRDRCVVRCEYCSSVEMHSSRSQVEEQRTYSFSVNKHDQKRHQKNRPFDQNESDFEQRWIYDDRNENGSGQVQTLLRKVWMCGNCSKNYLFNGTRVGRGSSCFVPRWSDLIDKKYTRF